MWPVFRGGPYDIQSCARLTWYKGMCILISCDRCQQLFGILLWVHFSCKLSHLIHLIPHPFTPHLSCPNFRLENQSVLETYRQNFYIKVLKCIEFPWNNIFQNVTKKLRHICKATYLVFSKWNLILTRDRTIFLHN